MAEIQPKGGDSGKGGKKRAKKMSTKIDMTPMVDLAFLLLTFFMLTTTFAKPNVMQLTMPVKEKNPEPQRANQNQGLAGHDYYSGSRRQGVLLTFGLNEPNDKSVSVPEIKVTDFSANGIRQGIAGPPEVRMPEPIILIEPYAERWQARPSTRTWWTFWTR